VKCLQRQKNNLECQQRLAMADNPRKVNPYLSSTIYCDNDLDYSTTRVNAITMQVPDISSLLQPSTVKCFLLLEFHVSIDWKNARSDEGYLNVS
jgi:hypothetical protein